LISTCHRFLVDILWPLLNNKLKWVLIMTNSTTSTNARINARIKTNLLNALVTHDFLVKRVTTLVDMIDCTDTNRFGIHDLKQQAIELFMTKKRTSRVVYIQSGAAVVFAYTGRRERALVQEQTTLIQVATYNNIDDMLTLDSINIDNAITVVTAIKDAFYFKARALKNVHNISIQLRDHLNSDNVRQKENYIIINDNVSVKLTSNLLKYDFNKTHVTQYELILKDHDNAIIYLGELDYIKDMNLFAETLIEYIKDLSLFNNLADRSHINKIISSFVFIQCKSLSIRKAFTITDKKSIHNKNIISLYRYARLESIYNSLSDIICETYYTNKTDSLYNSVLNARDKIPAYLLKRATKAYKAIFNYSLV